MKNAAYLISIIATILTCSCHNNGVVEKWQTERNNIVDVNDKIKYINTNDIYISQMGATHLVDQYILITDYNSIDKLVHIFDKNNFRYIASRINKGRGPGEIVNIGNIAYSKERMEVYISDNGKQTIYTYPVDSLINSSKYIPTSKLSHDKGFCISDYKYMNDTLSIGLGLVALGDNDFKASVAKINFTTGDVEFMKYEHPEIKRPRFNCASSFEHNIYVVCYAHHNLMTICDLNGNLKYNIYGKDWSTKVSNEDLFYGKVVICRDKIVASYFGGDKFFTREDGASWVNYSDKLIVFDIDGNYIETLDLGVQIYGINYDEDNDRLLFDFQTGLHQFGYLDLEDVL